MGNRGGRLTIITFKYHGSASTNVTDLLDAWVKMEVETTLLQALKCHTSTKSTLA